MSKEREAEKETFSPTPPYRERGEGIERTSTAAIARAHEEIPPVIDVHTPPSLELLLAWAKLRGYQDESWTRKWFDDMSNEYFWCYPKSGDPLRHWPAYFIACYRHQHKKSASKSHHIRVVRHADNWRGMRKEDIDHVLG